MVGAQFRMISQVRLEAMTTLIVVATMMMMQVLLAVSKGLIQTRMVTSATARKTVGTIVAIMAMTRVIVARALMIAATLPRTSQLTAMPLPVCRQKSYYLPWRNHCPLNLQLG